LHVLVEQRVISLEAALSVIQTALELTQEDGETMNGVRDVSATALIERIAASFAAKD
jgi:hypothetical protein